jgi:hypothetical protein
MFVKILRRVGQKISLIWKRTLYNTNQLTMFFNGKRLHTFTLDWGKKINTYTTDIFSKYSQAGK